MLPYILALCMACVVQAGIHNGDPWQPIAHGDFFDIPGPWNHAGGGGYGIAGGGQG
ncbi:hypothetical protein GWI33_000741, partial [Rhynchophorus ferrugineus]